VNHLAKFGARRSFVSRLVPVAKLSKRRRKMLRAKDVMSDRVVSVREDTPALEAVSLLVENNISGLPVIREDRTLVGVLSEKDALILYYEQREADDRIVGDYMTCPAVCFDEEAPLLEVCDFLAKNIFRRVPITSEGMLAGIISIKDVLEAIVNIREETSAGAL